MNGKKIFRTFLLSILFVVSLLLANFFIVLVELDASRFDGLILNLSGRQRMLSQRILVYTKAYAQPERQLAARDSLHELLRVWESSAIRIDQFVERTTFYYSPLLKSYRADNKVSLELLQSCKSQIMDLLRSNDIDENQLLTIEKKLTEFLYSMDKTVASYQLFYEQKLLILKYLEIFGLILSLLIIFIIIGRIAYPAQKRAAIAEETLHSLNHQLSWAMEQSRLAGFTLQIGTGTLKWTREPEKILGTSAFQLSTLESLMCKMDPANQKILQQAIDQLNKDKKRSYFECELDTGNQVQTIIMGQLEFAGISGEEERLVQGILQDITKYRLLKNEVEKSHRLFDTVIQSSPDALFFVKLPDNTIIDCNETALEMFGYSFKEELIGSLGEKLQVEPFNQQQVQTAWESINSKGFYVVQMDYRRKDGSIFHGMLHISMLREFDLHVVRVTDISDRFHRDKALQELKNELEEAHELSGLGSWSHQIGSRYLHMSKQACALLGYTDPELRFTFDDFSRLVHPDDRKRLAEAMENCFHSAGHFSQEVRFLHQTGHYIWLLAQGKPKYGSGGQVIGVLGAFMDINSRKLTELENRLLANVADKTNNGVIITNPDGLTTWINSGFTRISGFTLDDLRDKKPGQVLQGPLSDRATIKRISGKLKRKEGFNEEIINYSKEGKAYWVQINVSPVFNEFGALQYFIAIQHDVTERKETEQKIIESREKYKRAQMLAHLGHWSIRFKPHSVDWSDELFDIYGRERALGSPSVSEYLEDIVFQEDIAHSLEQVEKAQKEGFSQFIQRIKRPDGSIRYLETNCQPFYEEGKIRGVNGTCIDITEKVLAEQLLIVEKKKAEEASKAKADFLSTMSHEIRTPLNAIIGLSHLLLQNQPRKDQEENLKTLRFSGENLLSLINDILDFSKIEAGKIQIEQETFDFSELIRSIQHTFVFKAKEKKIQFRSSLPKNLPRHLKGDSVRLTQILNNLLGNAFKFTDAGYVGLIIKQIEQTEQFCRLEFNVEDTGIGISQEQQKSIFDSFTQASASITRKYGGTGLGLSITKKLLKLLGSDIHLKSKPGEGSTFSFELRFEIPTQATDRGKNQDVFHELSLLEGKKVLLAEDNKINVMVARQFLENWKFSVDVAENGLRVLELLRNNTYDVVLMDIQMPEMDGLTAASIIKKENLGNGVPMIALTASALAEVQERVFQAGMVDFVTKPFQPDELRLKVSKAIADYKGLV
jgi:PAS domain S-box-containing protein